LHAVLLVKVQAPSLLLIVCKWTLLAKAGCGVLPVWQNLLLGANCQVLLSTECVDWSSYLALEDLKAF